MTHGFSIAILVKLTDLHHDYYLKPRKDCFFILALSDYFNFVIFPYFWTKWGHSLRGCMVVKTATVEKHHSMLIVNDDQ